MLEVEGLRVRYGRHIVLRDVGLRIPAGSITALLGDNGAGKTTFVRTVLGLVKAEAGSILVDGEEMLGKPLEARRSIGYAAQEPAIFPTLTVGENLSFAAKLRGAAEAENARLIDGLALGDLLPSRAGTLSGGQIRRLHTALALIGEPKLVFLDEPTAGVDLGTRDAVLELVRSLARDGSAVCYTTHYLPEVEALDADIVALVNGRVLLQGTLEEALATFGPTELRFVFAGDPPPIATRFGARKTATELIVPTNNIGPTVASVLADIGPEADSLMEITVEKPTLETAYRSIMRAGVAEVDA